MDSQPPPVGQIDVAALPRMLDAMGGSLRCHLKRNMMVYGGNIGVGELYENQKTTPEHDSI